MQKRNRYLSWIIGAFLISISISELLRGSLPKEQADFRFAIAFILVGAIFLCLPKIYEKIDKWSGTEPAGTIVVLLIIVAFGLPFIMSLLYDIYKEESTQKTKMEDYKKTFSAHLDEYIRLTPNKVSDDNPFIRGRLIIIEFKEKKEGTASGEISTLNTFFHEDKIAKSPEEIGTVIWLKRFDTLVGRYTDGADAFRVDCSITIIDKKALMITGEKTLLGEDPPKTKSHRYAAHGYQSTDKEIVAYIASLPVK